MTLFPFFMDSLNNRAPASAGKSTTVLAAKVAVTNPYACKKAPPPISLKPLHDTPAPDFPDESETVTTALKTVSTNPETTCTRNVQKQKDSESARDNKDSKTTSINDSTPLIEEIKKTQSSVSLPQWQRLPSRSISFGSAEILTVPECYRHFKTYLGRSVRVTGTVLHRHVHDDCMISLVIGDPLEQLHRQSDLKRRLSTGSGDSIANSGTPKTPGTATKRKSSQEETPAISSSKTKRFVKKTPSSNTNSLLQRQQHGGSNLVGVNQPLTAIKRTPLEAMVDCLSRKSNCVWIMVNPDHAPVHQCAVGDLMMIIGELRLMSSSSNGPKSTLFLASKISSSTKDTVCYLEARILRNANGTNMKLYEEALSIRRRFLQKQSNPISEVDPPYGWGPPLP